MPVRLHPSICKQDSVVSSSPSSRKQENTIPFKGFGDRESAIKHRRFKYQQHWDYLRKDFSLSCRSFDVEYEGYATDLGLAYSITLVQGWLGAGKTEGILNALASLASVMPVIWLAPRNLLLADTERRAEAIFHRKFTEELIKREVRIYHYQEAVTECKNLIRNGEPGLYCMCPESLKDHTDEHLKWDRAVLVADEFRSIRAEIVNRSAQFKNFQRALAEASKVIAIDAFLSDVDVAILKRFRPNDFSDGQVRIYRQKFQKSTKPITLLECMTKGKDPTVSFSHEGLHFPLLKQWLENGVGSFCIGADNKRTAKVLKNYLESLGRKVLLVSADTPTDSIPFMKNPNQSWDDGDWDVLIYTPTIESGADIQSHFDRGLLIATGVLSPLQMLQMLGRCRQCQQWFVSAPRMSIDPTSPSALNTQKLRQGTKKLQQAWDELEQPYSAASTAWELHQSAVREIEKCYNSEYLRALLETYFEQVSVEFVTDPEVAEFRAAVQESKKNDGILEIGSDLEKGMQLIAEQKQPIKDTDVYAVRLAKAIEKNPDLEGFVNQYKTAAEENTEESLARCDELAAIYLMFTSERVDRIKNWLMAQDDEQCETTLAQLHELQKADQAVYNSGLSKTYRNIRLYKELELKRLSMLTSAEDGIAHETMFHISSPIVTQLWEQFKKGCWSDCFPLIETRNDFFNIVKRCLRFMGFQQHAKYIRVETDELHPNGKDRNGNQRYSKSKPVYFIGWFVMDCSGNEMFKDWFPRILKCIHKMVARDNEKRQERVDKKRGHGTQEDCLDPPNTASPPSLPPPFEVGQKVQDMVTGFSGVVEQVKDQEFLVDGVSIYAWRTADKLKAA